MRKGFVYEACDSSIKICKILSQNLYLFGAIGGSDTVI
jgi:hypothetical protein